MGGVENGGESKRLCELHDHLRTAVKALPRVLFGPGAISDGQSLDRRGVKAKFFGKSQVVWAIDDGAVSPAVSQGVATNLKSQVVNTPYNSHSYEFYPGADGLYADDVRVLIANAVSSFFTGT